MKKKIFKNSCFKNEEWAVTEDGFSAAENLHRETIFSLGNGYMAMRGTFEEGFSGDNTSPTTYIAGVFDYQKFDTLVMKGRNIFPDRTNFMSNYPDLFGITPVIGKEPFSMLESKFTDYRRTLDLKKGVLSRRLIWVGKDKKKTEIVVDRIVCMDDFHIAAVSYKVKPLNYSGSVSFRVSLGKDGTARSLGWEEAGHREMGPAGAYVALKTKQSGFTVAAAMGIKVISGNKETGCKIHSAYKGGCVVKTLKLEVKEGGEYRLEKIVSLCTSRDIGIKGGAIESRVINELRSARNKNFSGLMGFHVAAWEKFWKVNDITVNGDIAFQQGIRFCQFQLHQAYRGNDPGVNIGSKGLASGGPYFWDSEVYLLPFYLYTDPQAAKNLILYRYHTLGHAREIAKRWGYKGAKFPWMTVSGEEMPFQFWDCIVGEIHINAAISYGVWHYAESAGDTDFLVKYGAELLVETARFWADRVVYNNIRRRYVINQVTGPDEYMPMVNNNCYTNSMVQWSLKYTCKIADMMRRRHRKEWDRLCVKISFEPAELKKWKDIAAKMYIPFDRKRNIHLQDDTFLYLDHMDPMDVPEKERPLEENHWPFEKIMRYDILKQPDVVLLMYLLNNNYSAGVKRSNYDFYEPKTIHDSSLSPCIHSIMASETGNKKDAYYYARRSVRLDLDNYNNNTKYGIHTASTSGARMAVINGFGGMRLKEGQLCFDPKIPAEWRGYAFKVKFRGRTICVNASGNKVIFSLESGDPLKVKVKNRDIILKKEKIAEIN